MNISYNPRSEEINDEDLVVLWDAGAYCHVMASQYNMRPKRAEMLVEGKNITMIREPDCIEDILAKTCFKRVI